MYFYRCRQVINNDGKTQDLADRVFHKIKNCTGFYPMMIVMNLHRSKLDVNRRLAPATFGDEFTARIYNEYHGNATLLADAMTNATNSLSTGLGVDIHGFKDNPGDNFGERSSLGTYKRALYTLCLLTLNAPITKKVVCFSRLLKCLRSLFGKQCGPRSDCSYRTICSGSTLFASILNSSVMLGNYLQQTTSEDNIFRCIFLCVLRVNK